MKQNSATEPDKMSETKLLDNTNSDNNNTDTNTDINTSNNINTNMSEKKLLDNSDKYNIDINKTSDSTSTKVITTTTTSNNSIIDISSSKINSINKNISNNINNNNNMSKTDNVKLIDTIPPISIKMKSSEPQINGAIKEQQEEVPSWRRPKEESNILVFLKLLAILSTLYFFMWSTSLLSQAFNLTSYHYAGHFIKTSGFLQNPIIGIMIGIITTVLFQSSGAVISVLVTIVGAGVIRVEHAIPIVMGANLGTSVTNTVVSLIIYRGKSNFEVAMTAGIIHDMYNMLTVVFLLPMELWFHPLERTSGWLIGLIGTERKDLGQVQFLSYIVKPFSDAVILIDNLKIQNLTEKHNLTIVPSDESLIKRCCNEQRIGNQTICLQRCRSLFSQFDLSDNVVCILILIMAMATLFTCLIFVVKVTKSLLGGKLLNWVSYLAKIKYRWPFSAFVGYLFILVGLVITVILHSSGVFTSMLVPLAGGEVLSLMQIYELTLGSNVGTTTTGILAALSAQSKVPALTLQVAFCHCLFNVSGILMFYAIPHTQIPLWAAQNFGRLSAKNTWFSITYLLVIFLLIPSITVAVYFATH